MQCLEIRIIVIAFCFFLDVEKQNKQEGFKKEEFATIHEIKNIK